MNAITTNITASGTLASRAMVVSLSISQWSGRRLDREITDEVNSSHNAAADAGRFNKLVLPKEALDPIVKVVSETRTEFLKRTLPWIDNGGRIMAADAYMRHLSWINAQRRKFDAAVDTFLLAYPTHVAGAPQRMGTAYRADDYPDASVLRGKFAMDCNVLPVPSADDFRVAMSEAQAAQIKADIEAQVTEATTIAVKDVYRRVADVSGRMVDRLNAYKPAAKKGERSEGVFRDSLVENVRDLIAILPALNITGDPALTAMADKLKPLAEWDASTLRDDPTKRRDVAAEAQAIFDQVSDFLA